MSHSAVITAGILYVAALLLLAVLLAVQFRTTPTALLVVIAVAFIVLPISEPILLYVNAHLAVTYPHLWQGAGIKRTYVEITSRLVNVACGIVLAALLLRDARRRKKTG